MMGVLSILAEDFTDQIYAADTMLSCRCVRYHRVQKWMIVLLLCH